MDEAIRRQRLEEPGTRDPERLLMGLGLMREGRLLNAAIVLFAQTDRLLPSYPQCLLKLARFSGIDKTEFIDNRQEYGNVFQLLHRAQRDYSIPGGSVSLAIYDDRLEISSTGVLPSDLQPQDLLAPHPSRPWNPLIAQTFYRRGIIEAWGRGTLKIRELSTAAGLPPPEFECASGEVTVRFRIPPGLTLALRPELRPESQRHQVLALLLEGPLRKSEVAARLGHRSISGGLNRLIRLLLSEGLIEHTIPDKPRSRLQRYRLTPAGFGEASRRSRET